VWDIKIFKGINLRRDIKGKSSEEGESLKASRIIDQDLSRREQDRWIWIRCSRFKSLKVQRRVDYKSPEVIWDHPSLRRRGGARSTTSKIHGQGGDEIAEVNMDRQI
jgi:hypothetical protein